MKLTVTTVSTGDVGDIAGVCPHCSRSVVFQRLSATIPDVFIGPAGEMTTGQRACPDPECHGHVFFVSLRNRIATLYPRPAEAVRSLPAVVPDELRAEFDEAAAVLRVSHKASAALSRRILQRLLREHGDVKSADLAAEIQQVLNAGNLPPYLSTALDAVRNIGNFAAHPMKSTSTGQIIDVEPGEAEWLLDVLEMLSQFFFVQPADAQAKRDALNKKLADLGKPPLR